MKRRVLSLDKAKGDLFLDVLSATATKRDAKSYLANFNPTKSPGVSSSQSEPLKKRYIDNGVNLGNLYLPVRSIDDAPVFSQSKSSKPFIDPSQRPLHAALIIIKSPQKLDDETLRGIGHTLSQLSRLGMISAVVVDPGQPARTINEKIKWRRQALQQADRIVDAIEYENGQPARRIDGAIGIISRSKEINYLVKVQGDATVTNRDLLLKPMERRTITVIPSLGFETSTQSSVPIQASEVVLALTREFAGLTKASNCTGADLSELIQATHNKVSLDRIIILDSAGGIPSNRSDGSYVFINLEQEFSDIMLDLKHRNDTTGRSSANLNTEKDDSSSQPTLPESEVAHLRNLQLIRDALFLLPPSSSALITSPEAVAQSSERPSTPFTPGVGTRPQRNLLIHNLLTDKPVLSSSLPPTRQTTIHPVTSTVTPSITTFVKKGMPITIFPNPRSSPWKPPLVPGTPSFDILSPQLDIPRLVHLINDSFGRPLDAKNYLTRISPLLAGVIIAGSYEGGAILTWEKPSTAPEHDSTRLVPYLDKFAVLKSAQGTGGVADAVFSAMVLECFPGGVCWRSRSSNPVNKWYFERARGSWKIPKDEQQGEGWTMFWTTEGISKERFADYEDVCRSIGTSWADGKRKLD